MITVLEYLWEQDWRIIYRLLKLGLLGREIVKGMALRERAREEELNDYECLMRAPAYRRVRGALRQVRWG